MKKMKMDDDFQNYLVEGARFEGDCGIPCMFKMTNIIIPKRLVPYIERKSVKDKNVFLHCFIHDFQLCILFSPFSYDS